MKTPIPSALKHRIATLLVGAVALALSSDSRALTFEFANIQGAGIRFAGDDIPGGVGGFTIFPGRPANQFIVTGGDGIGDGRDKMGRFDSVFAIGPITVEGMQQQAPVTGLGRFTLHDGAGFDLTGNLAWSQIETVGTLGSLHSEGRANLTGINYAGSVADFVALASAGEAALVLTFQFVPGRSLTQLTTDGFVNTTSLSGQIIVPAPVPEPSMLALMGLSLIGGAILVRRKPSSRA